MLRATTACTFSTSQLPKVVRDCQFLTLLTWKCASRHNGVQLFISHLASWLRTRRFSEPTFRPSGATKALFGDLSGNGYVVTLSCLTVSVDVAVDAEGEDLFTNTASIPCTIKHDSEERLQTECCFLLIPIVLVVWSSTGNKEGVRFS